MKAVSFFIIFFLISNCSYSKEKGSRIDTLKRLLPKVKGIEKLQVLSDISEVYMMQNDFENFALNQVKLEKELDKNLEGSEEVREVFYCNQAYYYNKNGDLKKAILFFEKLLEVPSNSDKSLQFKVIAYTNLSEIFKALQQFQEALGYLNEAQKLISNRKVDLYTKLIIILNKSAIYKDLTELARGKNSKDEATYFKKAHDGYVSVYDNLKKVGLSTDAGGLRLIQTYDITAKGLYFCNRKNEAQNLFDKGESFLLENKLYAFYYSLKTTEFSTKLNDYTLDKSDYNLILEDLDNTIKMQIPYRDSNFYFELYLTKAELLYRIQRYKEALMFYEKAEKLIGQHPDNLFNMQIDKTMAILYEKFGDLKKSLTYKNRSLKAAEELLDSNAIQGEKKIQALLEVERMKQAKELEFEKMKAEKSRNYIIMLLLGLVLTVVIVVLLILFNKNLKTKQKLLVSELNYNKEVALKNELESFYKVKFDIERQKALAESEQEIATNLHDDLASGLAAMNFFIKDKVSFATTEKDKKSFNEIKDEVNSMYEGLRKYIHNLYNNKNHVLSVNEYLYDLMRQSEALNSVKFNITADFQEMDSLLSIFQQNQLYRIVKETVANSLKYSNSKNVNVTIGIKDGLCNFLVKDDGKGFSYTSGQGIGLRNIQDRIATLGGEVIIKSNPTKGVNLAGSFKI